MKRFFTLFAILSCITVFSGCGADTSAVIVDQEEQSTEEIDEAAAYEAQMAADNERQQSER